MEEKLNAYPLKFEPNLKTVIWGGGKIRKLKKLADAPDCIGESWELTGVPGQESVVSNGEYAGRDIKSLLDAKVPGIIGAITGRAIYEGTLDVAEAQSFCDNFKG